MNAFVYFALIGIRFPAIQLTYLKHFRIFRGTDFTFPTPREKMKWPDRPQMLYLKLHPWVVSAVLTNISTLNRGIARISGPPKNVSLLPLIIKFSNFTYSGFLCKVPNNLNQPGYPCSHCYMLHVNNWLTWVRIPMYWCKHINHLESWTCWSPNCCTV